MTNAVFDNLVWHTLCGPHSRFATGSDTVRRYVPGFAPFVGFSDLDRPDFTALAPLVAPGEQLYCDGWSGSAPQGWDIAFEGAMCRLVWDAAMPDRDKAPDAVVLDSQHAAAAFELANLTQPGPFGARTIELGEYLGVFKEGQLVAMAGGRICAGRYREITGVCTHPAMQGQGLARRLILALIRRQMQRGEVPFLRVLRGNDVAHRFYRRLGFRDERQTLARMFSRCE